MQQTEGTAVETLPNEGTAAVHEGNNNTTTDNNNATPHRSSRPLEPFSPHIPPNGTTNVLFEIGGFVAYEYIDRRGRWRWALGLVMEQTSQRIVRIQVFKKRSRFLSVAEQVRADAIKREIERKLLELQRVKEAAGEIARKAHQLNAWLTVKRYEAAEIVAAAQREVDKARNMIRRIEEAHLRELRTYRTPPLTVKLVLEAVVIILNNGKDRTLIEDRIEWEQTQHRVREKTFISDVYRFDPRLLSEEIRSVIDTRYATQPNFCYDAAVTASKAAGSLFKWVIASGGFVKATTERRRVENKLVAADSELAELNRQLSLQNERIGKLEETIETLRDEYEYQTHEEPTVGPPRGSSATAPLAALMREPRQQNVHPYYTSMSMLGPHYSRTESSPKGPHVPRPVEDTAPGKPHKEPEELTAEDIASSHQYEQQQAGNVDVNTGDIPTGDEHNEVSADIPPYCTAQPDKNRAVEFIETDTKQLILTSVILLSVNAEEERRSKGRSSSAHLPQTARTAHSDYVPSESQPRSGSVGSVAGSIFRVPSTTSELPPRVVTVTGDRVAELDEIVVCRARTRANLQVGLGEEASPYNPSCAEDDTPCPQPASRRPLPTASPHYSSGHGSAAREHAHDQPAALDDSLSSPPPPSSSTDTDVEGDATYAIPGEFNGINETPRDVTVAGAATRDTAAAAGASVSGSDAERQAHQQGHKEDVGTQLARLQRMNSELLLAQQSQTAHMKQLEKDNKELLQAVAQLKEEKQQQQQQQKTASHASTPEGSTQRTQRNTSPPSAQQQDTIDNAVATATAELKRRIDELQAALIEQERLKEEAIEALANKRRESISRDEDLNELRNRIAGSPGGAEASVSPQREKEKDDASPTRSSHQASMALAALEEERDGLERRLTREQSRNTQLSAQLSDAEAEIANHIRNYKTLKARYDEALESLRALQEKEEANRTASELAKSQEDDVANRRVSIRPGRGFMDTPSFNRRSPQQVSLQPFTDIETPRDGGESEPRKEDQEARSEARSEGRRRDSVSSRGMGVGALIPTNSDDFNQLMLPEHIRDILVDEMRGLISVWDIVAKNNRSALRFPHGQLERAVRAYRDLPHTGALADAEKHLEAATSLLFLQEGVRETITSAESSLVVEWAEGSPVPAPSPVPGPGSGVPRPLSSATAGSPSRRLRLLLPEDGPNPNAPATGSGASAGSRTPTTPGLDASSQPSTPVEAGTGTTPRKAGATPAATPSPKRRGLGLREEFGKPLHVRYRICAQLLQDVAIQSERAARSCKAAAPIETLDTKPAIV